MAKLKVLRLEIVAPTGDKSEILDYLQRKGAAELSAPEGDEYGFTAGSAREKTAGLNRQLQTVENCEKAMHRLCPQKKPLTAMLEPRKDMTESDYESKAAAFGDIIKRCERIVTLYKQLENDEADIVRYNTLITSLEPWRNLDIPLHSGDDGKVSCLVGSVRERMSREDILKILAENLPGNDAVEIEIISQDEMFTCFTVFCLSADTAEVEGVLRNAGFARAPEYPGMTASAKISECEANINECKTRIAKIENAVANEGGFYERLEFAKDYISISLDKYNAFSLAAEKGSVFYLRGFAAEKDANSIKKHIEKDYDAAVEISEPGEDEDVPVILRNNAFAEPLQNITGMYSLPSRGDMDPTGIMAFFYYFFFGMMLSDAGYGLIIVALTGGVLLFKRNLERSMKNTCKMYLFCGISTTFWGAMYGSWFGDAAKVICTNFLGKSDYPAFFKPWWTDASTDLMHVLVLCFVFGLVHLFVGVALKGVTDWRNGHKADAVFDTLPTYLTIVGVAPIFFNLFPVEAPTADSTAIRTFLYNIVTAGINGLSVQAGPLKLYVYILIAGLLLIVATGGRSSKSIGGKIGSGLYEVYNVIGGYLGDVLSYARLLALGLATGIIAQVMNMLGTLPSNQVLKTIMFVVVFIVGHIANLAINIIGAYVHTNRLQYVEFFGKFYEGGGRAFVPLKANTKYYKFKEEN